MSAGRKSPTVVTPVIAAMTAGSPICKVEASSCPRKGLGRPWWKTVWPCEPITSRCRGRTPNFRQARRAASAKMRPRRKLSWLISPGETCAPSAMRSTSARTAAGKGTVMKFSRRACAAFSLIEGEMHTSATSMPSTEVPDMRPRARVLAARALEDAASGAGLMRSAFSVARAGSGHRSAANGRDRRRAARRALPGRSGKRGE